MSDEGLILHWDMFAIENGKLEDASGKDNDGLIQGSPQLVPDDIFGGCLSFNEFGGTGDRVTAADISLAGKNPAHTIEAWIYIGSVPGTQSRSGLLVLGPYDSGAHRWSLTSKGVELGDWDKPQFIATIPSQAWTHIAMVYDGKLLSCYINGVALEKPKPATFGFAKGELTVAQGAKGDLDFSGKIASIRVYDRALKAEEIVLDMQDDQTAMASFRQANPLDFHLDDDDDQQVLYITDDPAGRNLKVEITNASRQAIEFVKQSSDVAAADNCHLELRFRPGTLSEASLNQISVAESDWRLAKSQANGAGVSLYLLNAKGAIVKPTEKINLTLQRVAADGGGGARGTRVELKYRQLKYPNDAALIEGSRIQHLSVVNQRGRKNIPLHAGFVGSNVVLNDGASSSTLKLRITNALREDSIPLAPAGPNASRLIVSFDSELATSDHVDAIQVECEGWTPLKIEQGVSAEWILTNGNKTK
ncbi:MAG TPA: LamG domain-containing protein, partial [Blastocatellia bacterium]